MAAIEATYNGPEESSSYNAGFRLRLETDSETVYTQFREGELEVMAANRRCSGTRPR